jgi:hypothetical protein
MGSEIIASENRREGFRISYPIDYPRRFIPRFYINLVDYRLLDISQRGIHFIAPGSYFTEGEEITAWIKFYNSAFFEIEGIVIRRSQYEVVVNLTKEIPYRHIYLEQIRLKKLELKGAIRE